MKKYSPAFDAFQYAYVNLNDEEGVTDVILYGKTEEKVINRLIEDYQLDLAVKNVTRGALSNGCRFDYAIEDCDQMGKGYVKWITDVPELLKTLKKLMQQYENIDRWAGGVKDEYDIVEMIEQFNEIGIFGELEEE